MYTINLVIFGAKRIKHPIASGGASPRSPASEIHLYSLIPLSENHGSAPEYINNINYNDLILDAI